MNSALSAETLGEAAENPSPVRKLAKMADGRAAERKTGRLPLATIVDNATGLLTRQDGKRNKSEKQDKGNVKGFSVFVDFEEESGPESRLRQSDSASESLPTDLQSKSNDVDALESQSKTVFERLSAIPSVPGARPSLPRTDSSRISLVQDLDEPEDVLDTVLGESPMLLDDEDASSQYESAVSSTGTDYHTAPSLSAKELHGDLVYCVPDYVEDIFAYLMERERETRPKASYMKKQRHINAPMRRILVDWLVEVAGEYTFDQETLHLAVRALDRFLSTMEVPRPKLQLLGTTCMMIAAKFEEIFPPELSEFVYITDDSYTKEQVLRMEKIVLDALEFDVSVPTCLVFASRFLKASHAQHKTACLARYLCDLTLLDVEFLNFLPSRVAGAAVCLANLMTDTAVPWPMEVVEASGYTVLSLYRCVKALLTALKAVEARDEKALYHKYSDIKFCCVSLLKAPEDLPQLI